MKKILAVFLCAVLIFCTAAVSVSAEKEETIKFEWDKHPLIFIQGYSGPILIRDMGLETEEQIWGINPIDLTKKLLSNLFGIVGSLADYSEGDQQPFIDRFKTISAELLDNISMTPDGSSKYNITPFPNTVETASVAYINEEWDGDYLPIAERDLIADMCQTVPADNIFIFNTDWRRSQITNSKHLSDFIDEVLAYTGSDKVDIYSLSHGGQLTATYLYYYGTQDKVDNVVMNSPAIGGSSLVMELLGSDPIAFNLEELLRFAGIMLHAEIDLRWVAKLLPAEFFNSLAKTAFNEVLLPYAVYFGSVWDLMDIETYTALRDVYLDPVENAQIIDKADKLHYDCMANIGEGLRRARESGVNINIIAGYGTKLGTGAEIDTDYIIDTVNTTGANVAPFGERFTDGYRQLNTSCKNFAHNHISPTRTVDASCAFLPENTWYIYGQYHTQGWWDDYARPLLLELLFTDNIKDVYSNPKFPQFEIAQNPLDGIYAAFEGKASGSFDLKSDTLVLRNLSKSYRINVSQITINGKAVDLGNGIKLGKKGEDTVAVEVPKDADFIEIKITYNRRGTISNDSYSRTLYFTKGR